MNTLVQRSAPGNIRLLSRLASSFLVAATLLPAPATAGTATTTMPVSMTITAGCTVTATSVAFPTQSTLGAATTATGTLNATCTNTTPYNRQPGQRQWCRRVDNCPENDWPRIRGHQLWPVPKRSLDDELRQHHWNRHGCGNGHRYCPGHYGIRPGSGTGIASTRVVCGRGQRHCHLLSRPERQLSIKVYLRCEVVTLSLWLALWLPPLRSPRLLL